MPQPRRHIFRGQEKAVILRRNEIVNLYLVHIAHRVRHLRKCAVYAKRIVIIVWSCSIQLEFLLHSLSLQLRRTP